MSVETASHISQLNTSWPQAVDLISEGDDHIRLIKTVLKTQFPNFGTNAINATATEVNYLVGVTSGIQAQFTAKANTASPTFTGTVVLPSTTSIGSVTDAEIGRLSGVTSPIQTQIDSKGAIAGQTWTGPHNYTGATITVPTATAGDSSTKAASTAFVAGVAFNTALPGQAGNTGKFTKTDGTNASWDWPELELNYISTSTTAVAGKHNVITAGGITVTIPTLAAGVPCAFTNASDTVTPVLDWGTTKFRGQASPGLMTLDEKSASFLIKGTGNATLGYV